MSCPLGGAVTPDVAGSAAALGPVFSGRARRAAARRAAARRTADAGELTMQDDSLERRWYRRRFLRGTGLTAVAVGLAGCTGTQQFDFTATPMALAGGDRYGFVETDTESRTDTQDFEASGVTASVSVTSHLARYDGESSAVGEATVPVLGRYVVPVIGRYTVGILSTPTGSVLGRSINPIGQVPLESLVSGEASGLFAMNTNADWFGIPSGEERWATGPTVVDEGSATILEGPRELYTYAGTTSDARLVLLGVTRFEADEESIVLGAVSGSRPLDPDEVGLLPNPRVGSAGDGLLTADEVSNFAEVARLVLERLDLAEGGSSGSIRELAASPFGLSDPKRLSFREVVSERLQGQFDAADGATAERTTGWLSRYEVTGDELSALGGWHLLGALGGWHLSRDTPVFSLGVLSVPAVRPLTDEELAAAGALRVAYGGDHLGRYTSERFGEHGGHVWSRLLGVETTASASTEPFAAGPFDVSTGAGQFAGRKVTVHTVGTLFSTGAPMIQAAVVTTVDDDFVLGVFSGRPSGEGDPDAVTDAAGWNAAVGWDDEKGTPAEAQQFTAAAVATFAEVTGTATLGRRDGR